MMKLVYLNIKWKLFERFWRNSLGVDRYFGVLRKSFSHQVQDLSSLLEGYRLSYEKQSTSSRVSDQVRSIPFEVSSSRCCFLEMIEYFQKGIDPTLDEENCVNLELTIREIFLVSTVIGADWYNFPHQVPWDRQVSWCKIDGWSNRLVVFWN